MLKWASPFYCSEFDYNYAQFWIQIGNIQIRRWAFSELDRFFIEQGKETGHQDSQINRLQS